MAIAHANIIIYCKKSCFLGSLVQLFIGGNNLSDVGLQRLTTPIRILKKGLNNLQLLDLSCESLEHYLPLNGLEV